MFFKKKVGKGVRGEGKTSSPFFFFFSLSFPLSGRALGVGFLLFQNALPSRKAEPCEVLSGRGDKGFLGAPGVGCRGVRSLCWDGDAGPASRDLLPSRAEIWAVPAAQDPGGGRDTSGGICPQGGSTQGCSGSISISPSGSVQDAALGTLEQPHPSPPSILSSLAFLTHRPHWSKQSFQTSWFGKGINHEPLSLFHLNIKLKSKQYKVHFFNVLPHSSWAALFIFFRGTVIKSRDKARTVLCRSLYLCYLSPFFTLRAALLFFALISLHQNAKNRKKKIRKKERERERQHRHVCTERTLRPRSWAGEGLGLGGMGRQGRILGAALSQGSPWCQLLSDRPGCAL